MIVGTLGSGSGGAGSGGSGNSGSSGARTIDLGSTPAMLSGVPNVMIPCSGSQYEKIMPNERFPKESTMG